MKNKYLSGLVLVVAGCAAAQTYTLSGAVNNADKLGAHQNGGRGCVGCHAPHSGEFGSAVSREIVDRQNAGNSALWGQDLGPLYGIVINQGDLTGHGSFQTVLPASSQFVNSPEEVTGIMLCLSCHDGNIGKNSMMTNVSYEQAAGLLPGDVYGPNPIPTLLGNDGTPKGNYYNDHPVGPQATLGAVGVAEHFIYAVGGCRFGDCLRISSTSASYQSFANHYGAPNIISNGHSSPVALPDNNPAHAYVLCTTCHDPHSMNVADVDPDAPIAQQSTGTHTTYFFIAAPYNPAAKPNAGQTSSTTQFCRQCHFSGTNGSNEASGIMNVSTAF